MYATANKRFAPYAILLKQKLDEERKCDIHSISLSLPTFNYLISFSGSFSFNDNKAGWGFVLYNSHGTLLFSDFGVVSSCGGAAESEVKPFTLHGSFVCKKCKSIFQQFAPPLTYLRTTNQQQLLYGEHCENVFCHSTRSSNF